MSEPTARHDPTLAASDRARRVLDALEDAAVFWDGIGNTLVGFVESSEHAGRAGALKDDLVDMDAAERVIVWTELKRRAVASVARSVAVYWDRDVTDDTGEGGAE